MSEVPLSATNSPNTTQFPFIEKQEGKSSTDEDPFIKTLMKGATVSLRNLTSDASRTDPDTSVITNTKPQENIVQQRTKTTSIFSSLFSIFNQKKQKKSEKEKLIEKYDKLPKTTKNLQVASELLVKLAKMDAKKAGEILQQAPPVYRESMSKVLVQKLKLEDDLDVLENLIIGAVTFQAENCFSTDEFYRQCNNNELLNDYLKEHISPMFHQEINHFVRQIPSDVILIDKDGNPETIDPDSINKVKTLTTDLCVEIGNVLIANQKDKKFQQFQRICQKIGSIPAGASKKTLHSQATNLLFLNVLNPMLHHKANSLISSKLPTADVVTAGTAPLESDKNKPIPQEENTKTISRVFQLLVQQPKTINSSGYTQRFEEYFTSHEGLILTLKECLWTGSDAKLTESYIRSAETKLTDTYKNLSASYKQKTDISEELKYANAALLKLAKLDPVKAGRILASSCSKEMGKEVTEDLVRQLSLEDDDKKLEIHANLIIGAASYEVDQCTNPGTLLRDNTVGNELLNSFLGEHILPKLRQPIKHILRSIPKNKKFLALEKDKIKKRLTKGSREKIQKLLTQLRKKTSEVLSDYQEDKKFQQFQRICHSVGVMGDLKFPGSKTGSVVAGNLLFLRGIFPMITSPTEYGINVSFENAEILKENTNTFAQIFQRIVNNQFGDKLLERTPYLKELQNYASGELIEIQALRDQITNPSAGLSPAAFPFQDWSANKVYENSLLFNAVDEFAESKQRGNITQFMRKAYTAMKETDTSKFRAALTPVLKFLKEDQALFDKFVTRELIQLGTTNNVFDEPSANRAKELLQQLLNRVIDAHWPELVSDFKKEVTMNGLHMEELISTVENETSITKMAEKNPEEAANFIYHLAKSEPERAAALFNELNPDLEEKVTKFLNKLGSAHPLSGYL